MEGITTHENAASITCLHCAFQLQFVHANPVNLEAPSNSLGSSSWRGDDVGDAIQGYDIDLYYGDADPLSASQVWIPETNPQYSNQNNVPVILTKIP